MKAKVFIISTFSILIIFFLIYFVLFNYQLGTVPKNFTFSKKQIVIKNYIAKKEKNKKIIIISGSNSLYGINSKYMEDELGYKIVNMAFWASMDMSFFYYQLKDVVKEGDIVLMPLEYKYYSAKNLNENFIDAMMFVNKKEYLSKLNFLEYIKFFTAAKPAKIIHNVLNQDENKIKMEKIDFEIKTMFTDLKNNGYFLPRQTGLINSTGTRESLETANKKLKPLNIASVYVDEYFIKYFNKISKLVVSKNAKLILTYPLTYQKFMSFSDGEYYKSKTSKLKRNLTQANIFIKCNPFQSFISENSLMANSKYHANRLGAFVRTISLVGCLKSEINDKNYNIDNLTAFNRTKSLEKKYMDNPNLAKSYFTKQKDYESTQLRDLKVIKNALEKYYIKYNSYPVSEGFDGLYTKWGKEGKIWIKGLVPEFLDSLPRDPRINKNKTQQYLYKSDGKDYKLIANGVIDCKKIKKITPQVIDPKRDFYAYGFWTEGAKNW